MQGDQPTTFAAVAETDLRRSEAHDPYSSAALYWAIVGAAWATLAVAEELRRMREGPVTAAPKAEAASLLRSRERAVLTLLGNGHTNVEIAETLGLSRYTVKDHVTSIYRKLGARNRAEAVRLAQEHGLL